MERIQRKAQVGSEVHKEHYGLFAYVQVYMTYIYDTYTPSFSLVTFLSHLLGLLCAHSTLKFFTALSVSPGWLENVKEWVPELECIRNSSLEYCADGYVFFYVQVFTFMIEIKL